MAEDPNLHKEVEKGVRMVDEEVGGKDNAQLDLLFDPLNHI